MGRKSGGKNRKTIERIEALLKILSSDRPVSVRYCMYTLLSQGLIASTKEVDKITTLCRNARIDGTFDDECFVDNRRRVVEPTMWDSLQEYKNWIVLFYRRNFWFDQPQRIECWLEKDTTSFLVETTTEKWGIPLRVSTGYFSRPFLCKAAGRLSDEIKPITIAYIGDFDASGLDIERAARMGNGCLDTKRREGLFDILKKKHGWTIERFQEQITWQRIGTTYDDFRKLPDNAKIPVKQDVTDEGGERLKRGDPRAAAFIEKYGKFGAEVEALEVNYPGLIARRVEEEIQKVIDKKLWKASERKEKRDRKELAA